MIKRRQAIEIIAAATAGIYLAACKRVDSSNALGKGKDGFTFGSGDIALLNFLFMLKQVSTAFYQFVLTSSVLTTADEPQFVRDMGTHELAHREFLSTALGANAIPTLTTGFKDMNSNRASLIDTALLIEDTTLKAGNTIVYSLQSSSYTVLIAKIVSVQARHSTYLQTISGKYSQFRTSVRDTDSLEAPMSLQDAFLKISPFIQTQLDIGTLNAVR